MTLAEALKLVDWRSSKWYRRWRVAVIRRDKICKICGSIKRRHAHHLNHATYFPLLRFAVSNGICLCYWCHMNFHNNFKRSYRTKCTEYDFKNFLVLVRYVKSINTVNK